MLTDEEKKENNRTSQKKYYLKNIEKIKEYRESKKDIIKEYKRNYYKENKERECAKNLIYRRDHKKEIALMNKKYRERNEEKIREKQKKVDKKYSKTLPDHYVARMMGIPVQELRQYPILMELKRNNIKLNRLIKERS